MMQVLESLKQSQESPEDLTVSNNTPGLSGGVDPTGADRPSKSMVVAPPVGSQKEDYGRPTTDPADKFRGKDQGWDLRI